MNENGIYAKYLESKGATDAGCDLQASFFDSVRKHPHARKTYRKMESYWLYSKTSPGVLIQAEITEVGDFHISLQGDCGYIMFGAEGFEEWLQKAF